MLYRPEIRCFLKSQRRQIEPENVRLDVLLAGDVEGDEVLHLGRAGEHLVDAELGRQQRDELLCGEVIGNVEVPQRLERAQDADWVSSAEVVHRQTAEAHATLHQRRDVGDERPGYVEALEQRQVGDDDVETMRVELREGDVQRDEAAKLRQRYDDVELGTALKVATGDVQRTQVRQRPLAKTANEVVDREVLEPGRLELDDAVLLEDAQAATRHKCSLHSDAPEVGDVGVEDGDGIIVERPLLGHTLEQLVGEDAVKVRLVGTTEDAARSLHTFRVRLRPHQRCYIARNVAKA